VKAKGWAHASASLVVLLVLGCSAGSSSPPARVVATIGPAAVAPTSTIALPTSPPTTAPVPTDASVEPPETEAWNQALGELNPHWDRDWTRVIAVIDGYRARFPDYEPAKEKLYAALVTHGTQLVRQGKTQDGVSQLVRAQSILATRGEATAALLALTPTPVPTATSTATARPTATPVPPPPAPAAPPPAPAQPAAPPQPAAPAAPSGTLLGPINVYEACDILYSGPGVQGGGSNGSGPVANYTCYAIRRGETVLSPGVKRPANFDEACRRLYRNSNAYAHVIDPRELLRGVECWAR
jgi:hypothetical protein